MKKTEPDGPRTMERRQFLGVSAAAGASAALGGNATSRDGATAGPIREAMPRTGNAACAIHRGNITWAMPSKHLNTLWTLLWPRVAARVWKKDVFWPEASPANPADIKDFLDGEITWFRNTVPPGGATPGIGSATFLRLTEELQAFLKAAACPPIRLLGVGGYDFYMTEEGIDLWAPPNPDQVMETRRQLMAMYEYRRTGRPAIAIGGVKVTAGTLPEAPTGPGQIEVMTPAVFTELCMAQQDGFKICGFVAGMTFTVDQAIAAVEANAGSIFDQRGSMEGLVNAFLASDRAEFVEQQRVLAEANATARDDPRYFELLREALPRLTPHPMRARLEQIEHDHKRRVIGNAQAVTQLRELVGVAVPRDRGRHQALLDILASQDLPNFGWIKQEFWWLFPQEPMCSPASAKLYECKIEMERCWSISGSVYRGVLEQFPRFVAERWSDDLDLSGGALTNENDVKLDLEGTPTLRLDIESRLESKLHDGMRFQFLDRGPTRPTGAPARTASDPTLTITPDAWDAWDPEQLMITNSGFFFPWVIGNNDPIVKAVGSAPTEEDLLDAIIQGRAGNPVFTDSSFSE